MKRADETLAGGPEQTKWESARAAHSSTVFCVGVRNG